MTALERQQAFLEGLKTLERQYGLTIQAVVQQEQLGPVWQVRAVPVVVPIDSWTSEVRTETVTARDTSV
jgi:hypothetical protein